ncbi:MAG: hypothetical protein A2Y56_08050 [Candidatus Aminicenantes bacterium RBG_13_63_10]|nr:MAG: hypothetical protein A2Y56_08050 [Candidatus Aminicenantes bacterium RBG_13_63_10]
MKTRVRLLGALFAVAALFPAATLDGCTIFTLAKDGVVLVGNNEDWWNPKTRMWFVPAREGAFGVVYFGFDNLFHQGGMNDRGLFFDANALPQKKLPPSGLPRFKGDLIDHVMKTCSTVEEVVKAFAAHDANAVLVRAQFHFADRNGDAVVIESAGPRRISGAYLISTNFRVSEVKDGAWPCRRYRAADKILSGAPAASPEVAVDALEATATPVTQYSNVFDLVKRTVTVYHFHDFNTPVIIDLQAEMAKGAHVVELPALFPEKPEFTAYVSRPNPRKLDGTYTVRWRNGKLRQQIQYKNGVLHGTFKEWDREGVPVTEVEYVDGAAKAKGSTSPKPPG